MSNYVKCSDCPYCTRTSNFWLCWCEYYRKTVYLTDGCEKE